MKCDSCGAPVVNGVCTYCGKQFNEEPPMQTQQQVPQQKQFEQRTYADFTRVNSNMNKQNKPSFLSKTWVTILFLIVFFPVGLYSMWRYKKFNMAVRIIITFIFACLLVSPFSSSSEENTAYLNNLIFMLNSMC